MPGYAGRQQRGGTHFIEKTHIVVAGGTVSAQRDVHAAREHVRDRCDTVAQFQIRLGTVNHLNAATSSSVEIILVCVHQMRRREQWAQKSKTLESCESPLAGRCCIAAALVDMQDDGQLKLI